MAKRQKLTRADKINQAKDQQTHHESTYAYKTRMERAAEFQEQQRVQKINGTGSSRKAVR